MADLLSDEDSKPKAKKTANLEPASQPPSQPLDPPKTSAAASQNRSKTMQELFGIDPGTTQKCESNITITGVILTSFWVLRAPKCRLNIYSMQIVETSSRGGLVR